MGLLWFLFGILCLLALNVYFPRLGKFSAIVFSNRVSVPFSLSLFFLSPIYFPRSPLSLILTFYIIFSFLIGWFLLPCVPDFYSSASYNLLLISFCVFFISIVESFNHIKFSLNYLFFSWVERLYDQWSLHLINCLYLFHSVVFGGGSLILFFHLKDFPLFLHFA